MYPSFEQIQALHKKYAPNDRLYDLVFTHCQVVNDISLEIIKKKQLTVNEPLVIAGALLHDIGTYTFIQEFEQTGQSKYYRHGLEGYNILKNEGFSEDICNIVLHHMRLGLTEEKIRYEHLDLPLQDYSPTTTEERIVMYADKFHSKKPQFNSFESYKDFVSQFGEEQTKKWVELSVKYGIPDLELLAQKYNHPIK
jgi:uncharacterized protein